MRKLIGIGLILAGIGIALLLSPWSNWRENWISTEKIDEETVLSADGVQRVEVTMDSENVRIVPGEREAFVVRLEGKVSSKQEALKKIETSVNNGVLNVHYVKKKQFFVGFNDYELTVIIEVPSRAYEKLSVETDSGDIELENVQFGDVKLHSDSGDHALDNIASKSLAITADSGDIVLNDTTGNVQARSDSGDYTWNGSELAWAGDIETDSGDIVYSVDKQPANASIEFETDSGDAALEWGDSMDNGGTIRQTYGAGDVVVKASSDSGDFTLAKRQG